MIYKYFVVSIFLLVFIVGCTSIGQKYQAKKHQELYGSASQQNRVLTLKEANSNQFISYDNEVRPILTQRCVVCHACYDAPCQVNLTNIEGIDRGGSKDTVYKGARFFNQPPSRLGIDAKSSSEWRAKGFEPILNERRQNEQINLDNSLLYQTLVLKRRNPMPMEGRLPENYDFGTNAGEERGLLNSGACPTIESFPEFAIEHPNWGMPLSFPGLNRQEFKTIETWLEQGARVEPEDKLPTDLHKQVQLWETFLNGASNKQKLMSRYVYEHLVLGHIYFEGVDKNEFFTLVRSTTPPGQTIDLIPTLRPYDNPGSETFYYRLKHFNEVVLEKTHLPYVFNNKRMARYQELFLDAPYSVAELPSYETISSANPFKTFVAIPSKNRYKFLLDDAQFFVGGFIKGPVCRGSIALGVIDDHFWVTFLDPENSFISADDEFLAEISDDLRLPSELKNDASLLSVWNTYTKVYGRYLAKRVHYLVEKYSGEHKKNLDSLWNGDGVNENAALTVYRHFDSATVLKGFVGEVPKTGWVMDYPILERIHYLLVAGFDVYGTVGHQLSTRLYFDLLRFESELNFLSYLPSDKFIEVMGHWNRESDAMEGIIKYFAELELDNTIEPDIKYVTNDVKTELFEKMNQHLAGAQKHVDYINLCGKLPGFCQELDLDATTSAVQKALRKLSDIDGEITGVFPDTSFVRIKVDGTVKNDLVYTILLNKAYYNVNALVVSDDMRIKAEDTIDIVEGFVGAYPNFFFEIDYAKLDDFVAQYKQVDSVSKYHAMVDVYGIRRTNPRFWEVSDWFYKKHRYDNPVTAGLFDLNRYKNR